MPKVLIVYGTAYGQTEKIVRRFARRLEDAGITAVLARGDQIPAGTRPAEFDGIVVAGSVLYGKHQRYLETFVRLHLEHLARRPSAFISVCGAMSSRRPEAEAEASKYRLEFLKRTGWAPRLSESFAGGLAYSRYGLITRWVLQVISRYNGGPTDTSRDWEFTDWSAVEQMADDFAQVLAGHVPAISVPA